MELTNFWIELKETQSGHQLLSCQIEGKHWVGFLADREGKREDETTYTYKSANMKPCSWDKCQTCNNLNAIFI